MGGRGVTVGAFAIFLAHCLAPTEIEVDISTDLACDQTNGVAVAVGAPNSETIVARGTACDDGGLGSVVIAPSGDPNATVSIRVTLGVVDGSAGDQCTGPDFLGCIVARRSLRYDLHHPLTLPVVLQSACLDTVCGPNDTCVDGNCIPQCDPNTQPCADGGAAICDPPTLVVAASQQTPHVAVTDSGYVIGYDANGAFDLALLDQNGASTGKTLTLSAGGVTGNIGPVGQTGASYSGVFLTPVGDAGLDFQANAISPSGTLLMTHSLLAQQVAREGLAYGVDGADAGFFMSVVIATNAHPGFLVCAVPSQTGRATCSSRRTSRARRSRRSRPAGARSTARSATRPRRPATSSPSPTTAPSSTSSPAWRRSSLLALRCASP